MYQKQLDALLGAWNQGDLQGLDANIAANFVRRAPASLASNANSLGELKQVIADFRTAFPDANVAINELYFQGDRSFARWTFTGTHTGAGQFPPTGRKVRIEGASFGRYEAGKLAEELAYFDAMEMLSQLGLTSAPGA